MREKIMSCAVCAVVEMPERSHIFYFFSSCVDCHVSNLFTAPLKSTEYYPDPSM